MLTFISRHRIKTLLFINLQNRVLESLGLNAVEHYQKFVERYPDALHALPQGEALCQQIHSIAVLPKKV